MTLTVMARTNITRTVRSRAGVQPTMVAVDATASPNGMMFDWSETAVILVKTSGTATVCTIDVFTQVDGLTVTDRAVNVPATTTIGMFIGPLGPEYRQADGKVYLNFDSATGATIGVLA